MKKINETIVVVISFCLCNRVCLPFSTNRTAFLRFDCRGVSSVLASRVAEPPTATAFCSSTWAFSNSSTTLSRNRCCCSFPLNLNVWCFSSLALFAICSAFIVCSLLSSSLSFTIFPSNADSKSVADDTAAINCWNCSGVKVNCCCCWGGAVLLEPVPDVPGLLLTTLFSIPLALIDISKC